MPSPVFILLALLWLPVGVAASALFRGMEIPPELRVWLPLLAAAPAGLPLALACRLLHRKGFRVTAWVVMAVLAVATVGATLVAGLLGPVAIVIYALVISLPAWLAVLLLRPRR